jgi:amino acid adenylation domain-containing protein
MNDFAKRIAVLSPEQRSLLERQLQQQGLQLPKTQTIPKRKSDEFLPLSFAQQRLWFLDQLQSGSPIYNVSAAMQLKGTLNIAVLQQTFNEIVRRHEILRTTFTTLNGQPVQVISPTLTLSLPVVDLQNIPASYRSAEAQQRATEDLQQPFNLSADPLLRTTLLQLSDDEHILLITLHHIISDGWCRGVFIKELATLYEAFSQGKPSPLPELPIQYADFAIWQRQWLQGEKLESQLNYWKQQLDDSPALLNLPSDRPRSPVQSFRGAKHPVSISRSLTDAIKAFSQQEAVTPFITLTTIFQLLLHRYTGQHDILIGLPIANRNWIEIEGLIGFFANTLVLRTRFSENLTFRQMLHQVRHLAIDAYAHQDLPFEKLVEELKLERNLSYNPLFQVMFAFQGVPLTEVKLPNLTLQPFWVDGKTSRFDLMLNLSETSEGLSGIFEYNTDIFDRTTIVRMIGHLQTLLEKVVSDPDQRLSEVSLMGEMECCQLLVEWNQTQVEYPQHQCIHQLFEAQVERIPDAIAVVFGEQQFSYEELNHHANQLAHYLRSLGVEPETPVGICLERSVELVIALLGILKAGGAYVPLDPTYPQERLAFMLHDAQVPILLTQAALIDTLPTTAHTLCLDTDWNTIATASSTNPPSSGSPDHLSYVIYTSGSTGQPKGVMNTHQGVCNRLHWMQDAYRLTPTDRVLQKTPFSFDVSVWEFFWPLMVGATLVVARPGGHQDSRYLAQLMADEHITTVHFVPSMLQVFLEEPSLAWCSKSLKRILCSGETLPPRLQQRFFERLEAELHNLYGPTEAAIDVTAWHCQSQENQTSVPIGRPIANTQIYLLDATGQPVPIGIPGELHIGGVQLARGYLHRPELTAEKFIPHPFSSEPGARLYKTGDLARYLADGTIEYLGRIDHQVKIRGFRIELGEIEAVLNQHPTVQQAVVLVHTTERKDQQLIAYVVSHPEVALSIAELRSFLREQLPEYMVPAAFVELDALPLTPNGKLDRRALPAPEQSYLSTDACFVPPHTPIEEILANIWAEVLGIESIGIYTNFFELGGHSLLATQVISRVRQAFQVEIPLRCLFEFPTLADFASTIETVLTSAVGLTAPVIEPIDRSEKLPLSFAQQRLWFLAQMEPDSPFYNIPAAIRLRGRLNLTALQQSLQTIVSRHEVLRLSFQTTEGQPTAVLVPSPQLSLPVIDLTELPPVEREAAVRALADAESQRPFTLDRPPLLRATLLQVQAEEYVLLFTMHHIVSDGWSIGVLVREVAVLYQAYCQGQRSPLPELPIQYVDFAVWQRQWLQGEVLQQQQDYWKQQLTDAPAVLELPTDYPRSAIQTFQGATYAFAVSPELAKALKRLSRQSGCTLFMLLLAAFQVMLARYSGQDDIVVGSPIANRNRSEVEGLIGFFVNTLVLRTSLVGHLSFRQVLQRLREVTLGAYAHQDVPFEQLVELLQPQRSLSYTPLFQVMFILQNAPEETLQLPGLSLEFLAAESGTAKFDLTLSIEETDAGLLERFEYRTDLFEETTIARMATHLETLLSGIVEQPEQCIWELPLLTTAEQHCLLREWNQTDVEHPNHQCIHQLFEAQVERTPDAIAVVFEDQQFSYQELNYRANQLAHYLQSLGVEPETLVGVYLERSIEFVIALLGILKAGGAYVPLDPAYPQARLAYILEDTQLPVLLTQPHLVEALPAHSAQVVCQVVCIDAEWIAISQESNELVTVSFLSPNHPAYVIYTSGSTGTPKGVIGSHHSILNRFHWMWQTYPFAPEEICCQKTSLNFVDSIWELFGPLLQGIPTLLLPDAIVKDPSQLVAMLARHQVSRLVLVPALLQVLVEMAGELQAQLPQLKFWITSGEALSVELVQQFRRVCPDSTLLNLYGSSEVAADVVAYAIKPADRLPSAIPIGRPIANTEIYILDAAGEPVPIGVPGELCVAGVQLARGYLHRPELTAEKFIPHPFSSEAGARLYRTGDLARYLSDGTIEYLGRIDHQVKIRGYRIEPGEIESVLSHHPQVSQAVVLAHTSDRGGQQLVAYIVTHPEIALSVTEVRDFLREQLPAYMVPSAFVELDALPLTPNGKVDRNALTAFNPISLDLEQGYQAPTTELEKTIATFWQEALHLEKVGIHHNFFDVGGHSLLVVSIHSKLQARIQREFPLIAMFQYPTISALARYLSQATSQPLPAQSSRYPKGRMRSTRQKQIRQKHREVNNQRKQ